MAAVTADGQQIVVAGGGGIKENLLSSEILSVAGEGEAKDGGTPWLWSPGPRLGAEPRHAMASATLGDDMYVIGGWKVSATLRAIRLYTV